MVERGKSHWKSLASELGADVKPNEPAPPAPPSARTPPPLPAAVPPARVETPPRAEAPPPKKGSGWNDLANEFGIESFKPSAVVVTPGVVPTNRSSRSNLPPPPPVSESQRRPSPPRPAPPAAEKIPAPLAEEPFGEIEPVGEAESSAPRRESSAEDEERGRRPRRRRGRGRGRGGERGPDDRPRNEGPPQAKEFSSPEGEVAPDDIESDEFASSERRDAGDSAEPTEAPKRRRRRRGRRRKGAKDEPRVTRSVTGEEGDDIPAIDFDEEDEVVHGASDAMRSRADDDEDEDDSLIAEHDDDDDRDGGEHAEHRGIPTWEMAIGMIVSRNLESRSAAPSHQNGSRGRHRGRPRGRGRGDK